MFKYQEETNSDLKSKDDFYCAGAGEMQLFEGKEHHLHEYYFPLFLTVLSLENFYQVFYSNFYETLLFTKQKLNPEISHLRKSG